MKPNNFHKQQKQSVARVKSIIRDKLSWMSGYPSIDGDRLIWRHASGAFYHDQLTVMSPDVIRKSQRAINTLFREYPKALPKVVGLAETWFQRHMIYLDAVKSAVKQGHWVNPGLALAHADADFQSLILKNTSIKGLDKEVKPMLYWRCFLQRPWLKPMVHAMLHWPDTSPGKSSMMDIAVLFALEPRKSAALIDWITYNQGHDCLTQVTTKDYADYMRFNSAKAVKKHQSAFNPKPINGDLMGTHINALLSQLSGLKSAHRSRALDYFTALNLKDKNKLWFNWYATTESICEKIRNHIHWGDGHNWRELIELRHQVKSQLDIRPADLKIDQILKDIITCASHKNQHNLLLQAMPEFAALSLTQATSEALLNYAAALFTWHQPKPERFKSLLEGLYQYLSLPTEPSRAGDMPWRSLPTHQWQHLDAKILKQLDAPQIRDIFLVINQIKQSDTGSPSEDEVHELLNLFSAGYDVPTLVGMYPALSKAKVLEDDFPLSLARFAREKALSTKQIIQLHQRYVELRDYHTEFDGLAFLFGLFEQAEQQTQLPSGHLIAKRYLRTGSGIFHRHFMPSLNTSTD